MKLIQVGLSAWARSNHARWLTAYACAKVTSGLVPSEMMYGRRMTQLEYGRQLGVTKQQVSRLSGAHGMYALLRRGWLDDPTLRLEYPHPFEFRQAPHVGTEHFTELGECQRKYALTLAECFEFLALTYDSNWSAEALRLFIDDVHDGRSQIPEWFTRASGVVSDLGKLRSDYGAPEEVKLLAAMTYDALTEWLKKGYHS